jgi:hypothetical protein
MFADTAGVDLTLRVATRIVAIVGQAGGYHPEPLPLGCVTTPSSPPSTPGVPLRDVAAHYADPMTTTRYDRT